MKKRITVTIISLVLALSVFKIAETSVVPVISNELAVGQLEDSDESFVAMQTFEWQRAVMPSVLVVLTGSFNIWLWKPNGRKEK